MIPGVNPKQMKQMMKKMGMTMEEIEGVEKVVIYTASGNYVFDNADVVVTDMKGMKTYQLSGDVRFEEAMPEIPEEDVTLVASQAGATEEAARNALTECRGDIAEAIIKLSQQ